MSESVVIEGDVYKIMPTEEFKSGFRKRDLVIDTGGDYPKKIPIQFMKDKCRDLDAIEEGFVVRVEAFVNGNEWNGKFYVSLSAYKMEIISGAKVSTPRKESTASKPKFTTKVIEGGGSDSGLTDSDYDEDDDMPF